MKIEFSSIEEGMIGYFIESIGTEHRYLSWIHCSIENRHIKFPQDNLLILELLLLTPVKSIVLVI
jgi:hypothetical protein